MLEVKLNERITSKITHYGRQKVLVLDGVFDNPDAIREYAISHDFLFQPPSKGSYPGLVLPIAFFDESFKVLYRQKIASAFSTVPAVKAKHRLGITCLEEDRLTQAQTRPHKDTEKESTFIRYLAAVTYLFDQPELGGTGFYSEIKTGEGEQKKRGTKSSDQKISQVNLKGERSILDKPSYICSSNRQYNLDGVSAAKYNRMVVFESTMLHSGQIELPSLLSQDICKGRLTLNSFFSSMVMSREKVYKT